MSRIRFFLLMLAVTVLGACEGQGSIVDDVPATRPSPASPSAERVVAAQAVAAPAVGVKASTEPDHSGGDVVRPAKALTKFDFSELPLQKADWNAPLVLGFRQIRANYDYYRVNKAFLPAGLPKMHGAVAELSGAVMPIEAPPADGKLKHFWLANPKVVMAGCVFCNPPTLGDLVYVDSSAKPLEVDREELYRGVVVRKISGRFFIEHKKTGALEYLFRMQTR